ncbi:Os05g0337100 [Oryza sativa Japonica Group]|uniref:Os05g0337100 protein n=1 Tax=Oryza sativa subsp. japonica TaxID=39947 RepID=C7J2G3_ORYSJ|nr:Os05g0337100 [Oryza sativa Japonica Group]|eukprot:NP_001174364.1 Os05g0337100 [Oryza sativa Japonica Group]
MDSKDLHIQNRFCYISLERFFLISHSIFSLKFTVHFLISYSVIYKTYTVTFVSCTVIFESSHVNFKFCIGFGLFLEDMVI